MSTKPMTPLALGLMSAPSDSQASRNSATVVVNDGPYHSDIVAGRPRFKRRGRILEVVRWFPRRGLVVTEWYRRFEAEVLPVRLPPGVVGETLRRKGFHPMSLYLKDGSYFSRVWPQDQMCGTATLRPVVVWQRGGQFFRSATKDSRKSPRRGH